MRVQTEVVDLVARADLLRPLQLRVTLVVTPGPAENKKKQRDTFPRDRNGRGSSEYTDTDLAMPEAIHHRGSRYMELDREERGERGFQLERPSRICGFHERKGFHAGCICTSVAHFFFPPKGECHLKRARTVVLPSRLQISQKGKPKKLQMIRVGEHLGKSGHRSYGLT